MIYLYSGTPGSGKSFHSAMQIYDRLFRLRKPVIANFEINEQLYNKKKKKGKFTYISNFDISPDWLIEYAKENHVRGKEAQTLIVLDEAQILYNPRTWSDKNRMKWVEFYTTHRHLGFDVILITQNDRFLDRQIRCLIETEFKHRKINNFKFFKYIPLSTFVCIEYWYGAKEKVGSKIFTYRKKYARMYDTFKSFNE